MSMAKALMIVLSEWEKRERDLWDEIQANSSPEYKSRMLDMLVELFYFVNTIVREMHEGMREEFKETLEKGGKE